MITKTTNKMLSLLAVGALITSSAHAVLVGHWPLNDAAGQYVAADTSGFNMYATNIAHANVTFGTAGAPITNGANSTCVTFIGGNLASGNDLQIPAFTSLNGAGKLTISIWVQAAATQLGNTTSYGILSSRDVLTSGGLAARLTGLNISQSAAGQPYFFQARYDGGNIANSAAIWPYATATPWIHLGANFKTCRWLMSAEKLAAIKR